MTEVESLKLSIEEYLNRAVLATSSSSALDCSERVMALANEFHYHVWHKHHTSGEGPKT